MSNSPAETIRRAAALMREQHGPEHVRHLFWHSLADWLDTEARMSGQRGNSDEGHTFDALKVARAYLGEEAAT